MFVFAANIAVPLSLWLAEVPCTRAISYYEEWGESYQWWFSFCRNQMKSLLKIPRKLVPIMKTEDGRRSIYNLQPCVLVPRMLRLNIRFSSHRAWRFVACLITPSINILISSNQIPSMIETFYTAWHWYTMLTNDGIYWSALRDQHSHNWQDKVCKDGWGRKILTI